jgi:large subunit ribosomal protein L28
MKLTFAVLCSACYLTDGRRMQTATYQEQKASLPDDDQEKPLTAFGGPVRVGGQNQLTKTAGTTNANCAEYSLRHGIPPNMMSRICDLTGKQANRKARRVTFSGKRNHKVQFVNLHWKRYWWPEANEWVRLKVSSNGMRTINKYGIDLAAKKYGLNLKKFTTGVTTRMQKALKYTEEEEEEEALPEIVLAGTGDQGDQTARVFAGTGDQSEEKEAKGSGRR